MSIIIFNFINMRNIQITIGSHFLKRLDVRVVTTSWSSFLSQKWLHWELLDAPVSFLSDSPLVFLSIFNVKKYFRYIIEFPRNVTSALLTTIYTIHQNQLICLISVNFQNFFEEFLFFCTNPFMKNLFKNWVVF